MKVEYNEKHDWYIVKERIDNQTFFMMFEFMWNTDNTVYYNIAMGIYNKRKHIEENENLAKITGKNPVRTALTAMKAFDTLEKRVRFEEQGKRLHISCFWLDNRRRDAYYRFLSKRGYQYGHLEGKKVIYKIYN